MTDAEDSISLEAAVDFQRRMQGSRPWDYDNVQIYARLNRIGLIYKDKAGRWRWRPNRAIAGQVADYTKSPLDLSNADIAGRAKTPVSAVDASTLGGGSATLNPAKNPKEIIVDGKFKQPHGYIFSFEMSFAFDNQWSPTVGKNKRPDSLLTDEQKADWKAKLDAFTQADWKPGDAALPDTAQSWGFTNTLVNPYPKTLYLIRVNISGAGTVNPPPEGLLLHWYAPPHWSWEDGWPARTPIVFNTSTGTVQVTRCAMSPGSWEWAKKNAFFRVYARTIYGLSYPTTGAFDKAIEDEAEALRLGL